MNVLATAFQGLIDYAGLYPPAALDMRTAVRNYFDYRASKHAGILGRFIVDLSRIDELREAAGSEIGSIRLSVIVSPQSDFASLARAASEIKIESIEVKSCEPLTITRLVDQLPPNAEAYFEISLTSACSSAIDALASIDARAKLRMGGVAPEAFPAMPDVARTLHTLADRRVAFKATAGLHHPVRASHALTYEPGAPNGMMHGFVNLLCAAAAAYYGETIESLQRILEDADSAAFTLDPDSLQWRHLRWTTSQVESVRRKFFTSFGSCSFAEPVHDLEALGWL